MPSERFDFPNAKGERLAGVLDLPAGAAPGAPRAYALFAHCFTCGKNVLAAKRIAEALNAQGIAVLRFDFTGIGSSEGEFANTTFSSNVADLVAAADHLRATRGPPSLLIGHSLGGAAVLAAAEAVAEAKAVVTIAAPCDPGHVTHLFGDKVDEIHAKGEVEVALAGRPFRIRQEFLHDVAEQKLTDRIARLRKALLIFHSPTDETVGIDNAAHIFAAAKHPKSFVSLAGADHLLTRRSDAAYVANVLAAWAERYLDAAPMPEAVEAEAGAVVVAKPASGNSSRRCDRAAPARSRRACRGWRARLRAVALRLPPCRARCLHVDDAAHLCRAQEAAAGARIGDVKAFENPCAGLRGVRNQGGQDRPHRARLTLTGDLDADSASA